MDPAQVVGQAPADGAAIHAETRPHDAGRRLDQRAGGAARTACGGPARCGRNCRPGKSPAAVRRRPPPGAWLRLLEVAVLCAMAPAAHFGAAAHRRCLRDFGGSLDPATRVRPLATRAATDAQSVLMLPASGPLAPCTTPMRTTCPSCSGPRPARSSTVACTNTSLPPASGVMKPNPLSGLYHFTVPVISTAVLRSTCRRGAPSK